MNVCRTTRSVHKMSSMYTCKCTIVVSSRKVPTMLAFGFAWLPRFPDPIGDLHLDVVPLSLDLTQHVQVPCRWMWTKYLIARLLFLQISSARTCATGLLQLYVGWTFGTEFSRLSQCLQERGGRAL